MWCFAKLNGVNLMKLQKYFKNQENIKFIIVEMDQKKKLKTMQLNLSLKQKCFHFEKLKKEIVYFFNKCTISSSLFIDIKEMVEFSK